MPANNLRHGHCRNGKLTRVYTAWRNMRARCYRQSCNRWKYYGGKGIRVCSRWHTFENFLADMGEPPPGMSLDRRSNKRNYNKANCRWATATMQSRNRTNIKRKQWTESKSTAAILTASVSSLGRRP